MADCFQCSYDLMPFKYLGLPVGDKPNKKSFWEPLCDKIGSRLNSWKAKLLSIGGRVTLIKAVLDAIPVFYMSLFRVPKGVAAYIDKLRRRFFWGSFPEGKKICWISWDKICSQKMFGGLGVKNILKFNLSLLGKWIWRFFSEPKALWSTVIKAFYGSDGGLNELGSGHGASSIWQQIVKSCRSCKSLGVDIVSSIKKKVGNGRSTRFWLDSWGPFDQPLCKIFPRLYALEIDRSCWLADRWNSRRESWVGVWNWSRPPRGRTASDLESLQNLLSGLVLYPNMEDKYIWSGSKNGDFTVKGLYDMLHKVSPLTLNVGRLHSWNSWIPLKVNLHNWRAKLDRLPSYDNLFKRGVVTSHRMCVLCKEIPESADHVFFRCKKVIGFWRKTWAWWKIQFPSSLGWDSISLVGIQAIIPKPLVEVFHGTCCILIWRIWKWRNCIIHGKPEVEDKLLHEDIFPSIQNTALLWIKSRCKRRDWDWAKWLVEPSAISPQRAG